ncbi:MAG: GNAT family N-acetyltransferase [Pseudomonadota bacterium]|nr:GNAT family N-acetyltransferase [Pseudomonadota bacterium]
MSTVLTAIDLRAGSVADLGIVDAIMHAAFDPRYGEAWTRSQCLGILAMPGVGLTLAAVDGRSAGFALARTIVDESELLLLATVPALRRRGVARALLRMVMADAADAGATRIHLEMRQGNDAIKLYRAAGFAKVGERRNYYRGSAGEVFDALTYSRKLV